MRNIQALTDDVREKVNELSALISSSDIAERSLPKASTKASEKYQDKVGLSTRSYKLKDADADAFKKACAVNGESQAAALTALMAHYVSGYAFEPQSRCFFCRFVGFIKKRRL
jgi:hypothetical protein